MFWYCLDVFQMFLGSVVSNKKNVFFAPGAGPDLLVQPFVRLFIGHEERNKFRSSSILIIATWYFVQHILSPQPWIGPNELGLVEAWSSHFLNWIPALLIWCYPEIQFLTNSSVTTANCNYCKIFIGHYCSGILVDWYSILSELTFLYVMTQEVCFCFQILKFDITLKMFIKRRSWVIINQYLLLI